MPVLIGWLRDRGIPPRYLVALSSLLVAIAPAAATAIRSPPMAILYGLNFGSVWGLKNVMGGIIYADYYGRQHLGSIQAIDSMFGIAGTAVGPLFIAMGREYFGVYRPVFLILAAMPLTMAVLNLFFLRPPKPPADDAGTRETSSIYAARP